ncbi:MAG TPA: hypothetical protein VF681_01040 [Abditibacteriaceae bacterium]|jgi:hypothetical protein
MEPLAAPAVKLAMRLRSLLFAALAAYPLSAATLPVSAQTPPSSAASSLPSLAGWNFALSDDELESAWTWTAELSPVGGAWETRIAFDRSDEKNYSFIRIAGTGANATARFYSVAAGTVEKQGDPDAAFDVGTGGTLSLQKSNGTLRLLWNGRIVSTATPTSGGDGFGIATRGAKLEKTRMQPLEAVSMRDDFMRAQGPDEKETVGNWRRVAGTWKTSGMLGPRADAELNPNPFVFRAQSAAKENTAFATTGSWFWNDYTIAASVRPTLKKADAPLVAGLAAYRQSDGTALRGEVDFKKGIARLFDGSRELARSAAFSCEPNQWHKIYLEPGPGVARLIVDGVERVRFNVGNSRSLAHGEAGLVSSTGANWVDFDDVRIGTNAASGDDFTTPSIGRWQNLGGEWQTRAANSATKAPARRVKVSATESLTVTGDAERAEGTVEARFAQSSGVGVAFAVRDAQNYFVARQKVRSNSTVLELVERTSGKERILASAPVTPPTNAIAVSWRDGEISATAGAARITSSVSSIPAGRTGAWAEATGAALLSFRALGVAPSWGEEKLPDKFAKDRLMQNWASASSLWQTQPGAADKSVRWHVGDFFSDAAVSLQLPTPEVGKKLSVRLGARHDDANSGARLTLIADASGWSAQLQEGSAAPSSARIDGSPALRFARRPLGGDKVSLRVAAAGKPLFNVAAAKSASGTRAAIATGVKDFSWDAASAQTANVLDYGFTGAPVDWRTAKGHWEVSERWTCQPQWGFFSGKNSVNPTLWSRFALAGDWTMEAYLATPMDMTRGERSPMDINVSVGDGRDLASGYSFLFGANGRARNRILRGDTIVRDTAFVEPKGEGNTHQDWFYVRLERRAVKSGIRFIYSVNGQKVWDYTDSNPLASATKVAPHLAFWTYNGGLSIARVRLWHSGVTSNESLKGEEKLAKAALKPESPRPLLTSFGPLQPRTDDAFQPSALLSSTAEKSTVVVNPQSGGDWTVYLTKAPFDAREKPILSWRYKVGPRVLVNLYALVENKWREIAWTGDAVKLPLRTAEALVPDSSDPGMGLGGDVYAGTRIGAIEKVQSDNSWHEARFDLATALKNAGLSTKVQALAFSAPDKDYLRCGIGGNHFGASYEIADFKSDGAKLATN